ncbi:hypothetical protein [Pararhizobium sp. IMCC21322]|uniref:hypothetical protein n=1 Tax=Pararhizobium sp. IMCC21322 TaxID=3067903 RepID=UPI002740A4C5|nr:hypothetical protein [Pararhizobium sp. IMCC21322]
MSKTEKVTFGFYEAGGTQVVMQALGESGLLRRGAIKVTGQTVWWHVRAADGSCPLSVQRISH